jgi:TonB family protein
MIRIASLFALSLLAAAPAGAAAGAPAPAAAPAQPEPAASARARANLATLFSDEDYPASAIRNGEQGAVAFRLNVGSDGSPTDCSVTASSGSSTLDSTTCTLLMERARFEPARDSKGKPTTDSVAGRIVWRLPDSDLPSDILTEIPPPLLLWSVCVGGEAAKLVPGDVPPAEVVRRAFGPCTALEALVERGAGAAPPMPQRRAQLGSLIEAVVVKAREALKAPPAAPQNP